MGERDGQKRGRWRATNRNLGANSAGLGYRRSKDLNDKMADQSHLAWDDWVEGEDEGDWVRCLTSKEELREVPLLGDRPLTFSQMSTELKNMNFENLKTLGELRDHWELLKVVRPATAAGGEPQTKIRLRYEANQIKASYKKKPDGGWSDEQVANKQDDIRGRWRNAYGVYEIQRSNSKFHFSERYGGNCKEGEVTFDDETG